MLDTNADIDETTQTAIDEFLGVLDRAKQGIKNLKEMTATETASDETDEPDDADDGDESDEAMLVAFERHSGLLYLAGEAVEVAISVANAQEAAQGYGPITDRELAEIMANMIGGVLGIRGISRETFQEALDSEWVNWEEPDARHLTPTLNLNGKANIQ